MDLHWGALGAIGNSIKPEKRNPYLDQANEILPGGLLLYVKFYCNRAKLCCATTAELSSCGKVQEVQQRTHGQQSLKYLLFGLLHKFVDPRPQLESRL